VFIALLAVATMSCTHRHGSPASANAPATLDSAARARSEREILDAEHEWVRVTLKGDADAFASFLADEYMELNSSGRFVDKAAWTSGIRTGGTHYDSVDLHDLHVRFPRPDVAVVTGAFSQKGVTAAGDNSHAGVYINTWVRIGGRWQVVSSGVVRPSSPGKP
jgi:ketosteroid isomerase-like protein